MMRRFIQLSAIGLFAASGCLSGSYNEEYLKSVQRYREEAALQKLHKEPKDLVGGCLRLRVPTAFGKQYSVRKKDLVGKKDPVGKQDPVGDESVPKPAFLTDFPEFAMAVSEEPKGDAAQSQAVLFLGAVIDGGNSQEEIKKKILEQVKKEALFAKENWVETEVAGGKVPWSVLKLVGSQPFCRINNGLQESNSVDGETQIWVASDPVKKVSAVLVWRVPEDRAATVQLKELAGLVARTVEFTADAAEPDPPAAK